MVVIAWKKRNCCRKEPNITNCTCMALHGYSLQLGKMLDNLEWSEDQIEACTKLRKIPLYQCAVFWDGVSSSFPCFFFCVGVGQGCLILMRGGHEAGEGTPSFPNNKLRDMFGFILRSHQSVRPATKGRALSMLSPSAEGEEARYPPLESILMDI